MTMTLCTYDSGSFGKTTAGLNITRQSREQDGIDNEEHGEENVVRDVEVTDFGPTNKGRPGKSESQCANDTARP